MAVGIPARMKRIEERTAQLAGRVRDVEDVQLSQLRKMALVERRLGVVLRCFEKLRRQQKRAEVIIEEAIAAVSGLPASKPKP